MRTFLSLGVNFLIALLVMGSAPFAHADIITPDCGFLGFIKRPLGFCPAPVEIVFNAPVSDIDIDNLRKENKEIIQNEIEKQLEQQGRVAGIATTTVPMLTALDQAIVYSTNGLSSAEAEAIAYSVHFKNINESEQFATLMTALSYLMEQENNQKIRAEIEKVQALLMKNILSTQDDISDAVDDIDVDLDTDSASFSSPTLSGDISLSSLNSNSLLFSNSSGYLTAASGLTITDAGYLLIGTTSPREKLTVDGPIYLEASVPTSTGNRLYNFGGDLYWNGSIVTASTSGNWTSSGGDVYRSSGNVGVGTTTPSSELTIEGDALITGALYDNNYSPGTNGHVLQTTSTGFVWVATSSLGITTGASTLSGLSDVTATAVTGSLFYHNGSSWDNIATSALAVNFNDLVGTADISTQTNLSVSAPGLELSGDAIALSAGYSLPLTASTTEWSTAYSWGDHSLAGYLSSVAPSDLALNNGYIFRGSASNLAEATSTLLITDSGNIGIGTTTPSAKLQVQGDLYVTGRYMDSLTSAGLNGYVLQSSGSATQWVATSSLGISGASAFLELTDTPVSYTANQIFYDDGSSITGSSNFVFNGSNMGIGTSTPDVELVIDGDFQLTGGLYDNAYTRGTNGQVMQTDGSGVHWVSTSSLGIGQNIDSQDINLTQGYTLVGDDSGNASATNTLFMSSDRMVGVGTVNPQDKLHIVGGNLLLENTQAIRWKNNAATTNTIMAYDSSNNLQIGSGIGGSLDLYSNNTMIFNANGNEYMRLLSTGLLGIGDSTADALLEVSASGGTDNLLMLSSNDANDGDLFIVDNGGWVGIGDSTPDVTFDLYADDASSYAATIMNGSTAGFGQYIWVNNADSDKNALQIDNSTGGILTVKNNGNVGIGTTSPASTLHIEGGSYEIVEPYLFQAVGVNGAYSNLDASDIRLLTGSNISDITTGTGGNGGDVMIMTGAGADCSETGTCGDGGSIYLTPGAAGTETGGSVTPGSYGNVFLAKDGGQVAIGIGVAVGTYSLLVNGTSSLAGGVDVAGDLQFTGSGDYLVGGNDYAFRYTTDQDAGLYYNETQAGYQFTDTNGTPINHIGNNGRVGIGNIAPAVQLHVGSTSVTDATSLLRLEDVNSACNFTADSGSPSCGSDRTLKKDISIIEGELEVVLGLEPSFYHWKTEDSTSPLQSGFIAQEVELVLPELVTKNTWIDGSEKKFLNIGGMMPYVVGAIKEMWGTVTGNSEKIESLEARIQALENELDIDQVVPVKRISDEDKESQEQPEDSVEEPTATSTADAALSDESSSASSTENVAVDETVGDGNSPDSTEDTALEENTNLETEAKEAEETEETGVESDTSAANISSTTDSVEITKNEPSTEEEVVKKTAED